MSFRDKAFAVVLAISTGVSGWAWNSYEDLHAHQNNTDKAIAVLEVTKADKDRVSAIEQQMIKQTGILEGQKILMEQQYAMLKYMITDLKKGKE